MHASICRTTQGRLMVTIHAESEVESIALDRWLEENPAFPCEALLVVSTHPE